MALLDGSILLGSQYAYEGRGPFDAKMLVSTYADLLSEETWQDINGNSLAYNGMLVAVWRDSNTDNNGVYFLHNGSKNNKGLDVSDTKNWHRLASLADLENGDYVTNDALETLRAALATKVDSGTISHSTEDNPEGVTVNGTRLNIVIDTYTKQEVLDKIDEKLTSFADGDVVTDIKNTLDSYTESNDARVDALESANTIIESSISSQTARLDALEKVDTDLAALIQNNTDRFNNYYTSKQVDDKISEISKNVESIDLSLYAKTADVNDALQTINATIATKANSTDVYTKDEINAIFVTEADLATQINTLIDAADPENDRVISNIQNLVKYVDENAGDIANLISDVANTKAAQETSVVQIAKNTSDIANINALLTTLTPPKSSDEISVAADGTLSIKEININKLTQATNDILILSGGSAE